MLQLDADGDGIVSSTELSDLEMKEQQKLWINRLMNLKNFVTGLLAGICICEAIIFVALTGDAATIRKNEITAAFNWITGAQQILSNIMLVILLTLAMVFGKMAEDYTKSKNDMRLEFQQLAQINYVGAFLGGICWVLFHLLPEQTNRLQYGSADDFEDADLNMLKLSKLISHILAIATWLTLIFSERSVVSEVELNPHQDTDNYDDEPSTSIED